MVVKKYGDKIKYDPNEYQKSREYHTCVIYLAGPMTDWRNEVIKAFSDPIEYEMVVFVDPSVPNHSSLDKKELKKHLNWEIKTARKVDIVIHWFDCNSPPLSQILEDEDIFDRLGDPDVIGMSNDYPYKKELMETVHDKYSDMPPSKNDEANFPKTIAELIERIKDEHDTWYWNID